ncbi:tyrosine-type recombinase/integrase [Bacillus cereus]|uniref:tyrosine-type recombinase/integrase n=1 Tax=Bacillus cereus TaxID=1396 RepID=UPI001F2787BE|nr:site-specific integrase [Bacillus cereus]
MAKKMTDFKSFHLKEIQTTEKQTTVHLQVTLLNDEVEDRSLTFRKKSGEEDHWETEWAYKDFGKSKLEINFIFAYSVLYLIEEKKLSHFRFDNTITKITFIEKERVKTYIDKIWYENNEYYRFLDEKKNHKAYAKEELAGKSKDTVRTYLQSLHAFYEHLFFIQRETFPNFNEGDLNIFAFSLEQRGLSPSYIVRTFAALTSYAKYRGFMFDKEKVRLPKLPNILEMSPRSLEEHRLDELNNAFRNRFIESQMDHDNKLLPNLGKQRDHYRNWVLFRLMLATGVRISEAIGLKISDLHLEGQRSESRYVHVRKTKTQVERKIPLTKEITHLLEEYLSFRKQNDLEIEKQKEFFNYINNRSRINIYEVMTKKEITKLENLYQEFRDARAQEADKQTLKRFVSQINHIENEMSNRYIVKKHKENPYLFISNRNQQVGKSTMMKIFQKMGVKSHQLRHTTIKRFMDQGLSINKIQKISGHKSADMVLRYAQPTMEEVAKDIEGMEKKFD